MNSCSPFMNGYDRCLEVCAGTLRVTVNLLSYYFRDIDVNDISTELAKKWS